MLRKGCECSNPSLQLHSIGAALARHLLHNAHRTNCALSDVARSAIHPSCASAGGPDHLGRARHLCHLGIYRNVRWPDEIFHAYGKALGNSLWHGKVASIDVLSPWSRSKKPRYIKELCQCSAVTNFVDERVKKWRDRKSFRSSAESCSKYRHQHPQPTSRH